MLGFRVYGFKRLGFWGVFGVWTKRVQGLSFGASGFGVPSLAPGMTQEHAKGFESQIRGDIVGGIPQSAGTIWGPNPKP